MKIILAILFLFAVTLQAETRHLKVSGDTAKPLPARLAKKATHTLELTAAQMKTHVSPEYFKVVDGLPVAKTLAEVTTARAAKQRAQAIKQANKLAESLKATPVVMNEGDKHQFTELSQTLFLAQFLTKDTDIRVRRKGLKSIKVNKAKAGRIFSELSALHNQIEDALEGDLDAIETGVLTLTNLKAIEASQKLLKE